MEQDFLILRNTEVLLIMSETKLCTKLLKALWGWLH